jgi:hypothetical protein
VYENVDIKFSTHDVYLTRPSPGTLKSQKMEIQIIKVMIFERHETCIHELRHETCIHMKHVSMSLDMKHVSMSLDMKHVSMSLDMKPSTQHMY